MNETSIHTNIIKTLLYYHIFNHPLTLDEIHCFCHHTNTSKKLIKRALTRMTTDVTGVVGESQGYYFIRPHVNHVDERLKKEAISHKRWKAAKLVTMLVKTFPFVRGIFVTGTLSKNSSVENSDIDFMIICREDRLWITRTLLRIFAKLLFLDNKYFCPNYFISEKNLSIKDRNIFTATELAYIKVMYNTDVLNRFIESNSWIMEYFPNYPAIGDTYHFPQIPISHARRSILQQFFELFYPGTIGDWIDHFLERVTLQHHARTAPYRDATQKRSSSYIFSRNTAKLHGIILDHKYSILETYTKLLKQYHIRSTMGAHRTT